MKNKIYVGDFGTIVELDCGEDISDATLHNIVVKKPDDTLVEWVGTIAGVGTDKISYTTVTGDFNQQGRYKFQAKIESPSWTGRGETVERDIFAIFT